MPTPTKLPPLVGRNPLVHLAGIAQSMENEYADCVNSTYMSDQNKVDRVHRWAAQACALFDLLEQIELDEDDLRLYRDKIDQYTVELSLRYKKPPEEQDDT